MGLGRVANTPPKPVVATIVLRRVHLGTRQVRPVMPTRVEAVVAVALGQRPTMPREDGELDVKSATRAFVRIVVTATSVRI